MWKDKEYKYISSAWNKQQYGAHHSSLATAEKNVEQSRALYGDTFWPPNRTFNAQKKWKRRTRRALRSIISNFKYRYQPVQKKIRVVGTLKKKKCFFYQISRKKYFEMISLHAPSNSHYAPENYIYLRTTM